MLEVRLNQPLTLDPKGRITLPARLKVALDAHRLSSLVFLPMLFPASPELLSINHLRAYTPPDFTEKVERPLLNEDSFSEVWDARQRIRLGFATEVDLDRQGRLSIPANLRQLAGLYFTEGTQDLILISILDRLELWEPARLDAWYQRQQLGLELFDVKSSHKKPGGEG
jgi:MraZ protein